ncbi:hypothetical protein BD560DRAFT_399150 [Blakeslea trispora]|nr:hypothetical protein BD560DRAFT_399150 [Blakeslea trispora]
MESIKPALDQRYHDYQEKVKKAQAEKQYQSMMPPILKDNKKTQPVIQTEWNLQEALKGVAGIDSRNEENPSVPSRLSSSIQYPNHSFYNQSDGYDYHRMEPSAPPHSPTYGIPPQLPPKIHLGPTLPPKVSIRPELPPKIKIESTGPTTDASTERGEPLRRMLLPQGIQAQFLSIAEPNTRNKIETCGILAGILKNNILKITTLIIPKQTGTSDTCTTENEEELFDIQDKHDLLTFGWIHTHPTQSCFLSSVDLHTHCSYQLMLPEAIAIVCAPLHKPNFGVFRLTDPPGLDVISECRQTPAFHPHPDLPIYTTAQEGEGHIQMFDYPFKVLDLRK